MDRIKANLSKYFVNTCLVGGGSFIVGFFAYYFAKKGEKTTLDIPESNSETNKPTGNEREIPMNILEKMVTKVKNRVLLTLASHFDKASTFIDKRPLNQQPPLLQPQMQQPPMQQQSDIVITTMNTGEAARNNMEETKETTDNMRREGYKSIFQGIININ
jgi:hypothetical protein